jgi:hypothetical protein
VVDLLVSQRVMTESGELRLEELPHYFRNDPQVRGYIDALSRELDRVEELINSVRECWFASDSVKDLIEELLGDDSLQAQYLRIWEYNLGLPIAPAGMTFDQRGNIIISTIRKRTADSGADWVSVMNAAFGTGTWSYKEDYADYTLRITIPYASGTITATSVLALARAITPAHVDIVVTYAGGGGGGSFIIGVSPIGVGQI